MNTPLRVDSFFTQREQAIVTLGHELRAAGYCFTTITPATHVRVNARSENQFGTTLEHIFGWSRSFRKESLPSSVYRLLEEADALSHENGLCKSRVRFSSLSDLLFVHSAFPTDEADTVFFGPDTYRFCRAIADKIRSLPNVSTPLRIVDIGCGSGAGGIYALSLMPSPQNAELVLGDINMQALRFSAVNAAINGFPQTRIVSSDVLHGVAGDADLIISNPPYLLDVAARIYRNGGGALGFDLSLRIVREGLSRLAPGGRLLLYTGVPVVDGIDLFLQAVKPLLMDDRISFTYQEIDPDVFGEELGEEAYRNVERIAVIVLEATRKIQSRTEDADAS